VRQDNRGLLARWINRERRHAWRLNEQTAVIELLGLDGGENPMLALREAPLFSIHHLPDPVPGEPDRRDGG